MALQFADTHVATCIMYKYRIIYAMLFDNRRSVDNVYQLPGKQL